MRIGFDISVLYVAQAGVYSYTSRLLAQLIREGQEHEFRLLDNAAVHRGLPTRPDLKPLRGPNVTLVHCRGFRRRRLANWRPLQPPGRRRFAEGVDRLLDPLWSPLEQALDPPQIARAIGSVDLFHSSDVLQFAPPGAISVITVHDLTTLLFPQWHTNVNNALHVAKMHFTAHRADAVIAVSESTRQDVIMHLGVSPDRVHVIHEAAPPGYHPVADRDRVRRAARRHGISETGYILHVGTLEPRKNLTRLVEAYGLLRQRLPAPPLVLAGRGGWDYEKLLLRVDELDLKNHVHITGYVPESDLPLLMNGAQVFVFPSLYEGFGLPPLEAMACGVPTVVADSSSLPEVVGDTALKVPPHDTERIAEALARLLTDEALRGDLGRRGLEQAARFSWTRAAQETLALYQRLING